MVQAPPTKGFPQFTFLGRSASSLASFVSVLYKNHLMSYLRTAIVFPLSIVPVGHRARELKKVTRETPKNGRTIDGHHRCGNCSRLFRSLRRG
jgi:hypothetical protein